MLKLMNGSGKQYNKDENMATNLKNAKQRILNKWNFENPEKSIPIILWGPIGLGKTSLVYSLVCDRMKIEIENQFVKDLEELKKNKDYKESLEYNKLNKEYTRKLEVLNFKTITSELLDLIDQHVLILRLAERPIEQLQGIIIPSMSTDTAKFVLPDNLLKVKNSEWGIIFLDELDKASDSKFAAATNLLENKVLGDYKLGKGWYVMAAANREEDSHLSNPIPPELRNRCANIEVELDLNVWIEWAVAHNVRRDFVMFHKATHGEWLAKYDLDQTYAFPTPRSWVMVSNIIDDLEKKIRPNQNDLVQMEEFNSMVRNELIDFVGVQAQNQFFTYRELYLKFNIQEILQGKKRITRLEGGNNSSLILNDQCIAAFAMADQVTSEMLVSKVDDKLVYKNEIISNLVQFIEDLSPEIRTIYLQFVHKTRIMNILLDSGQAENILDQIVEYITT